MTHPRLALPDDLLTVLRSRAICFVTTLMPDGSPQVTQTWVDTDGENLLINTVDTHQKARNIRRDPRVAVGITDPGAPFRSWGIRGVVTAMRTDGAREQIDELSMKYLGRPYPGFGGGAHQQRVSVIVEPHRIHAPY